ncbi:MULTISPECIES: hypothetical protein [Brevibacillus]|jgi:hypothetical protein|uniref:DUF2007 domain-containing protein n=1 Tax=Brevibacillus borstelensis AK1 TaxID=1300222 RepID=M8DC69_9BACL|nr:hypothetical protein [Brevibacillus borstelensis]EMT53894.1 hypothetical protein I532_07760 [Brevibacillus borstelensis AK1]KKX56708.1 hypothetical protein X546_01680 [Brevibacillus borstelensis cifa_chp40]MBE5395603.1 hypothetical protein [Brevibacillus borstelensis]MCC0565284.1 hypothetical protein [Brevibacillus borstelensis]MCM3470861.1 hypothetical protein [Brevibacillus borstelensis]
MWIKWVTIHESYGLPRMANECRHYLEMKGIRVRLLSRKTQRTGHVYVLQVPEKQRDQALEWLHQFKNRL